jgi:hypothetical protein
MPLCFFVLLSGRSYWHDCFTLTLDILAVSRSYLLGLVIEQFLSDQDPSPLAKSCLEEIACTCLLLLSVHPVLLLHTAFACSMGDEVGKLNISQIPSSYCYSFAFAAFLHGLASCLVSVFAFLFIAFLFSLMCFFQRRQSLTRSSENAALNTRNWTPSKIWRNGIWLGFNWNHVRGTRFWDWLFFSPSFTFSRCSLFLPCVSSA